MAGSSIEITLENPGPGTGGRKTLTEISPDEPAQVWTSIASLAAPPPAAALIPFSGAYVSDELDATYGLAAADGRLMLRRRGAEPVALEPLFENAFEARDLGVIVFEKNPAGRVSGFRLGVGGSALFFSRTVR